MGLTRRRRAGGTPTLAVALALGASGCGGGADPGTLTATFSDGTVWDVAPYQVNRNVQHFRVEPTGTLLDATTGDLPGRLVLSDFSCEDVKKK